MKLAAVLGLLAGVAFVLPGPASARTPLERTGPAARVGNVPSNFVKHQESPYWTWFGPRSWVGVYSAYGITITAPANQGSAIDYGGSSILCDGNPQQHFAGRRLAFANTPGLKRVRLRRISKVKQRGGTFSQTLRWSGRANGIDLGGTLGMQYASYDGTYCYQATLYKGAVDNRDFRDSMKTLEAVWRNTFYSGPGLPINPSTGLPRQR